jgi:hypothetical protein
MGSAVAAPVGHRCRFRYRAWTMEWIHYSAVPVRAVYSVEQVHYPSDWCWVGTKPAGFWVSNSASELDWLRVCVRDSWRLERLANRHVVTLDQAANLLRLDSTEALADTTDRFGVWEPWMHFRNQRYIDWRRVTEIYDGILVERYFDIDDHDPDCSWFSSWSCASGCIWRSRAIARIELVPMPYDHVDGRPV